MKISFQKEKGDPAIDIKFYWRLTIEGRSPAKVTDHFIPELFFDYFYVKEGNINCVDLTQGRKFTLSQQSLKTVHTRPLRFVFSPPLVLYGARLSLRFAETFWEEMKPNAFLKQTWVQGKVDDLGSFKAHMEAHLGRRRTNKFPYPLFSSGLDESDWLVNFSPRHKRRLYRAAMGLSRKELLNVRNVQLFLEQTCDFASENPRIIRHVNPDVFYDQPHLNRTFRKMTGFSPVGYFEANSILQNNLMSASYNEVSGSQRKITAEPSERI
jgi:methylphosphotriester-DNA--protein-cysteine methyltransferase